MLPALLIVPALCLAADPAPADNTVCPTCPMKVTDKSPTATVKGRKYRVCCSTCGKDLEKNPDKYLDAGGRPKNAKAK